MIELIYALMITNAASLYFVFHFHRKFKSVHRKDSVELREFLKHLMGGNAILRISVLDPGDLLLRTKRQ